MENILKPWPWYVVGPMIAVSMLLLTYYGKSLGISSNLRTLCTIAGAGKFSDFFRFDWKSQRWNLAFVVGVIIGSWIASQFLSSSSAVPISETTKAELLQLGISDPGVSLAPIEIFSWSGLASPRGLVMMVIGGILIGFGTRYANGCTSGHAISGLSNLQLPSLIAVIGFFFGGLMATYFILPWLLKL